MDISYFKEFVVLAETQNFWAAADRLFISESSLSKHIKNMENQLGATLFYRTSRKVELTEFGELMLPYAQSISNLQYQYESLVLNYVNHEEMSLEIATIPDFAHYGITDALLQFIQEYPQIHVNIEEADTLIVRELLMERKCDVAIFRDSPTYLDHNPDREGQLVKIPYVIDQLEAVLPLDHPLAEQSKIELSQLSKENFALIHQETLPYNLCIQACKEAGFTPNVIFTSHNLEAILETVRKGNCVSLLFTSQMVFPHLIEDGSIPSFVTVPITPTIQTTVCLSYRKYDPLSRAASCFIDYCMQIYANQSD